MEGVLQRGFWYCIVREKKFPMPIEKGLKVYELVKDKNIANIAMTAEREVALQKVENNEAHAEAFQKEINSFIRKSINLLSLSTLYRQVQQ
jgi:DNA topoisomerase III